jgi:DNA-binding CsgD family transcriptional regulator
VGPKTLDPGDPPSGEASREGRCPAKRTGRRQGQELSDRTEVLLVLLAQVAVNKETSLCLRMSERTVKARITGIFSRLSANSRTVDAAMRAGLRLLESLAPSVSGHASGNSMIQVGQQRCPRIGYSMLETVEQFALLVMQSSAQAGSLLVCRFGVPSRFLGATHVAKRDSVGRERMGPPLGSGFFHSSAAQSPISPDASGWSSPLENP